MRSDPYRKAAAVIRPHRHALESLENRDDLETARFARALLDILYEVDANANDTGGRCRR